MPQLKPNQQVAIRPGMSEAIDARHLPIGTPSRLENIRVRRGARFEKRPYLEEHSPSGLAGTANGLWVAEQAGRPVVGIYDPSRKAPMVCRKNPAGAWDELGRHGLNVPERRFGLGVDRTDFGTAHTCAAVSGELFIALADRPSETLVTVYRVDPDGVALKKTELDDAANPRLVYAGGVLYLVTREPSGSGTDIEIRTVNTSTLALGTATTLATLTASTDRFDTAPVENAATWAIAFPDSANVMRVHVMSGVASSVNTTVATTDASVDGIGIAACAGEYVCIAYYDNAVMRAAVLDTATLATSGAVFNVRAAAGSEAYAHRCGVVRVDVNEFQVVGGGDDSDAAPALDTQFIISARVDPSGVAPAGGPFKYWHYHARSKPWAIGADDTKRVYIWASNNGSALGAFWDLQGRNFILDVTADQATVDSISYEHLSPRIDSTGLTVAHLPEAVSLGGGRFATVLPWDDIGPGAGIDVAVWYAALSSTSMEKSTRAVVNTDEVLHISGAKLAEHSEGTLGYAAQVPENGFPYAPEIAVQLAGTTGNLTASEAYTYKAVYRWFDSRGRVHRSAPSEAKSVTTSSTNLKVTTRIATLDGSGKIGPIAAEPVAEIYRSWNGGPYYYVSETTGITSATFSDVSITLADNIADVGVEDNDVLYTDLGVLPTEPPSGARLICSSGDRLFAVGWRPNVVQFSKLYISTAPWEFVDSDTFRVFYPEELTALAFLDGALVAFSAQSIYLVTGDGPNDQGVGSYSTPRKLTSTAGSEGPHVVEVPAGLMYKSAGTIWLLPRGFGPPQPVGDDIQATLALFPYLRSAVRCANDLDDCTHFVLASSDTSSANTIVMVWDNKLNSWVSRDTIGNVAAAGAVGGVYTDVHQNWTSATSGLVRYLSEAATDEGGAFVTSRIAFGDWRPWGPLGWGRLNTLQVHGECPSFGTNRLNLVTVADGVTGTHAHTPAAGEFYAEHALKNPQGSAFRFELYDSVTTSITRGLVVHSLAFSGTEGDGLRRLSNSERF